MKQTAVKIGIVLAATFSFSVVASNDIIEKTSFAIGLEATEFEISEVKESKGELVNTTKYTVFTKEGDKYKCYTQGANGVSSDAMCSHFGNKSKGIKGTGVTCNALLKAAGKCN